MYIHICMLCMIVLYTYKLHANDTSAHVLICEWLHMYLHYVFIFCIYIIYIHCIYIYAHRYIYTYIYTFCTYIMHVYIMCTVHAADASAHVLICNESCVRMYIF